MNRDSFQRKKDLSGGPGAEEGRSGTAPLVGDSFERVDDLPLIQPRMRTAPLTMGGANGGSGDVFTRQADRPGLKPQTGLLGGKPPAAGTPATPGTDMFERQVEKKPETKPMTREQVLAPAALRTLTEQTIAKALPLAESLEPRVELLLHAFKAINVPVPGVEIGEFKHTLSPNSTKIVAYLTRAMQVKPGLPRQMAVAVFRYHEAVQTVEKAREALESDVLPPNILEELKLKFFYLANYHEEFKGDPILTQLFPAPKAGKATAVLKKRSTTPLTPAELLRQRQAKDAAIRFAETYVTALRPKMENLKLIVSLQKQASRLNNLTAMIKPQERKAMGVLKALKGDERGLEQITRALTLYEQFQAALVAAKKNGDVEPLKVFLDCFHQMVTAWSVHPVLKELVTAKDLPTQEIAPVAGAEGAPRGSDS